VTDTTVQVESLDQEGRGIAHADGKVIFIEGALTGETVTYSSYRKKPSFEQARVQTILKASSSRVTPQCAHFGVCGGCSMQHLEARAADAGLMQPFDLGAAHVPVDHRDAARGIEAEIGDLHAHRLNPAFEHDDVVGGRGDCPGDVVGALRVGAWADLVLLRVRTEDGAGVASAAGSAGSAGAAVAGSPTPRAARAREAFPTHEAVDVLQTWVGGVLGWTEGDAEVTGE
jgi:predicted RNA-binding protein with TRAM domain